MTEHQIAELVGRVATREDHSISSSNAFREAAVLVHQAEARAQAVWTAATAQTAAHAAPGPFYWSTRRRWRNLVRPAVYVTSICR